MKYPPTRHEQRTSLIAEVIGISSGAEAATMQFLADRLVNELNALTPRRPQSFLDRPCPACFDQECFGECLEEVERV